MCSVPNGRGLLDIKDAAVLQAKDIESYSSDPVILALAEQFCTSCSVSVSDLI